MVNARLHTLVIGVISTYTTEPPFLLVEDTLLPWGLLVNHHASYTRSKFFPVFI